MATREQEMSHVALTKVDRCAADAVLVGTQLNKRRERGPARTVGTA